MSNLTPSNVSTNMLTATVSRLPLPAVWTAGSAQQRTLIMGVALAILSLMLCIETLVDRHYGLAVIFITPLTIFIAEYGSGLPFTEQACQEVILARLFDTMIGCVVGLSGGVVMHSTDLRVPLRRMENWLLARFS